jgi:hypothetical protein
MVGATRSNPKVLWAACSFPSVGDHQRIAPVDCFGFWNLRTSKFVALEQSDCPGPPQRLLQPGHFLWPELESLSQSSRSMTGVCSGRKLLAENAQSDQADFSKPRNHPCIVPSSMACPAYRAGGPYLILLLLPSPPLLFDRVWESKLPETDD